jgi:hypothetical protein
VGNLDQCEKRGRNAKVHLEQVIVNCAEMVEPRIRAEFAAGRLIHLLNEESSNTYSRVYIPECPSPESAKPSKASVSSRFLGTRRKVVLCVA